MNKETLYRYFNGQATAQEVHEVRTWANASTSNADALRHERKLFNMLLLETGNAAATKELSPSPHTKRRSMFRILRPLAAAAAIIAAVIITLTVVSPTSDDVNLAQTQWLYIPQGQQARLVLADSSSVWINARSCLSYPTAFSNKDREVCIHGEAFFDVRHNDKVPFIVHAGDMDIRVLGTKFNVVADTASHRFEASLLEGRLRVEVLKPKHQKAFFLSTGQKLSIKNGHVTLSRINDPDHYRWREGLYCITAKPLQDICQDMQQYYDLKINIDNKALARRTLSGKFKFADGIDYNISVMAAELHFTYTHDYARRTITIQ